MNGCVREDRSNENYGDIGMLMGLTTTNFEKIAVSYSHNFFSPDDES